jgi:hypothetical protein
MKLWVSARAAFAKYGADDTLHRLISDLETFLQVGNMTMKPAFGTRQKILQENVRMYAE